MPFVKSAQAFPLHKPSRIPWQSAAVTLGWRRLNVMTCLYSYTGWDYRKP